MSPGLGVHHTSIWIRAPTPVQHVSVLTFFFLCFKSCLYADLVRTELLISVIFKNHNCNREVVDSSYIALKKGSNKANKVQQLVMAEKKEETYEYLLSNQAS